MSQYPPGYPQQYPMPYYPVQPVPVDPRTPARRASILMFIVGAIALLLAGCVGFSAAMMPSLRNMPEFRDTLATLESQAGISPTVLLIVATVMFGLAGLIQIVLGFFVRGGGLVAAIIGIVFTSLVLLYTLVNLVFSLITPGQLGGACMSVAILVVFAAQLLMLVQACRNANQVKWMQQAYVGNAAAWMQQQAQHPPQPPQYPPRGQYGYGYGSPQPPAAPPSAPVEPGAQAPTPPPANDGPAPQ